MCCRSRSEGCWYAHADVDIRRSKSWVEEEGEIFRKGAVLLGPEEMEGEYAGEELRREVRLGPCPCLYPSQSHHPLIAQLLEAMVERPPPRGIIDEFGMEVGVQPGGYDEVPSSPAPTSTPAPVHTHTAALRNASPSASPTPMSPTSPRGRAFPLLRGGSS